MRAVRVSVTVCFVLLSAAASWAQDKAAKPGVSSAVSRRTPEQEAVVKAAQAYMKAARAGDVAGLKAAIVAEAAPDLDGPDGKKIVEMLKVFVPAAPTITSVEVTGETAVMKLEEKEKDTTSTSTLRLKKVDGVWKVNPKG